MNAWPSASEMRDPRAPAPLPLAPDAKVIEMVRASGRRAGEARFPPVVPVEFANFAEDWHKAWAVASRGQLNGWQQMPIDYTRSVR
jgi:hypothetical protein